MLKNPPFDSGSGKDGRVECTKSMRKYSYQDDLTLKFLTWIGWLFKQLNLLKEFVIKLAEDRDDLKKRVSALEVGFERSEAEDARHRYLELCERHCRDNPLHDCPDD